MDGAQSQALDGMGRAGRGGGKGRGQAVKGAQPSLSTDDDTLVNTLQRDYIQRGKSRSAVLPDRTAVEEMKDEAQVKVIQLEGKQRGEPPIDATESCSPITLEYAEELLLMADTGRCAVLDVSEVPKDRPTGGYVYIYHSTER